MMRKATLSLTVILAVATVGEGSILELKQLAVDFTNAKDAQAKATWSPAEHLDITDQGLGWDGESNASRDGWIQTKPLAVGQSWRAPYAVSVRVNIQPQPVEITLPNGQKSTSYEGDVYVRYSPDYKHWSNWQALERTEPTSGEEKADPGRHYRGTVRVPYRDRKDYQDAVSQYSRLVVPWPSDEEATVRWILKQEPDFFARQLPFVGYIEFLFEQSFPGGQRIRSFRADVSYGMSGLHTPPKDRRVYKGRNNQPWQFKAEEKPAARPSGKMPTDGDAKADEPLGVLESFLGALAALQFEKAYGMVAPSSKASGDPIAYRAALDYKSFVGELTPPAGDDAQPADHLPKFSGYKLGKSHWESPDRFRILVTLQGWDNDEVLLVRERGTWYVADPIHIIR